MLKQLLVTVSVLAVVGLTSGCGGTPTPPPPVESPTEVPTTAPTEIPTESDSSEATPTAEGEVDEPDDAQPNDAETEGPPSVPGSTVQVSEIVSAGQANGHLFLGASGSMILISVEPEPGLDIGIEIQDTQTNQLVAGANQSDGSETLTFEIPSDIRSGLYRIIIGSNSGSGQYTALFTGSPGISFALLPEYKVVGHLPDGSFLTYTYSGPQGQTLETMVVPNPESQVDLMLAVNVLENLETALLEVNDTGAGEEESFALTLPEADLGTYIISVKEVNSKAGDFLLAIATDSAAPQPATGPKDASTSDPITVVQAVFDAAASGDFASLQSLCDPQGENDSDTQMICDLATDSANREEFVAVFSLGKVSGEAQISLDGSQAQVPFLFGPDGQQEEEMDLINRDGQWYLSSF